MPIFKCEKCGCMENTAACNYWDREDGAPILCSECDPSIGKWHGIFPKQSAKGMMIVSDGFLYSKEEVESSNFKWREQHQGLKVIGVV